MPADANEPAAALPRPAIDPALAVLVHGIWMTGLELQWLAYQLRRAGCRTHVYRYRSVRHNLADNARRFARFLAGQPPGTRVVGHSLGGLIAARALCDHPEQTAAVGRMVALGSPFLGSGTARKVAGYPLVGPRIAGQCFPLAEAGGGAFLPRWTAPQELGIIAGTYAFGAGQFLRAIPEPNDGIVALEETRLPGATEHLVLPINHVKLPVDRRSVAQTIHFLEHGRFAPAAEADESTEFSQAAV